MEIKLSSKSINRAVFSWFLYLVIVGTGLFVYIWDEFTAYGFGYFLGSIAKSLNSVYFLAFFFIYFAGYIALQACILYWLGGKKWKNLRYLGNWTAVTFCLKTPIPLKYYRISLLLPFILLGLLPAVHGFCTGDGVVFYIGLFGVLCSSCSTSNFGSSSAPSTTKTWCFPGRSLSRFPSSDTTTGRKSEAPRLL